ncbi:tetratricopeptide repeat protein [Tamlana sp. 2201CG12-4]|uniref:tetratricopeptide repeat protein n=1 Tax=Tamlana sp. 2201CG12-4 TaxID=3112582 RepID=UPI002DB69114|nr:tetratricopeptide repeat protein [Tamlana sp. 2201CG12-4]MEC3907422.1 tetratricopeptide repeat protein [Tamlana sp. 2201CG12-4]
MIFNIRVIILVLFIPSISFSQSEKRIDSLFQIINETKIDSVKAKIYLELSDITMYNDQIKTFQYLEKADSLYEKTGDHKGKSKLFAQKANYFYRLGKIDSARLYLSKSVEKSLQIYDTLRAAVIRHNIGILDHYQGRIKEAESIMNTNIPVFKEHQDSLHLGNAYLLKGKIAMTSGYYNIALKETFNALKIHKNLNNLFRTGEDLLQIGIIYQSTNEDKKAIEILNESIAFYDKIDSEQSKAQVLNYIAESNIRLKNYDQAQQNLENALVISKSLDYNANIARVYSNWGNLEFNTKNYTQAIVLYKKSLQLWQTIGSPNNEANALFYIGRAYSRKKEYSNALEYLNQSIGLATTIEDPDILKKTYLEKSIALENQKKYQESLMFFKKNKSISDSIFNLEQSKSTEELKTIYETEKKEQQIVLQNKEINILNQKAKINSLQRTLLFIGLLLSLMGFYAIRQKLKRNKLEKEKVDNELAFKKKELTTHALHLAKKNEVLEGLKQKAKALKTSEDNQNGYQELIRTINFDLKDDKNWDSFSRYFQEVHKDFNKNVKTRFPNITPNELRLMSLLKMNLSSKEIANILNISQEGIKKARYRLRKKLDISTEDSLLDMVLSL